MKLLYRFVYYLGGLSIGLVLVFFFLSGKKTQCSYFPNARVLKEIRSKHQNYAPEARAFLEEHKIDTIVIQKLLKQGDVNFSKSQTDRDKPCREYIIDGKHNDETLRINVKECKTTDSLAEISEAKFIKE